MGRVAVLFTLFCVLYLILWHLESSSNMKSQKVKHPRKGKRNLTQQAKKKIQRTLLQWSGEKNSISENPNDDDDSPFLMKLRIPTEADYTKQDLANNTVERYKLYVEQPLNSSCRNSLNWLCYNESAMKKCANQNSCNSSNALIMGGVQPNTFYVIKANNDSVSERDLEILNSSVPLPIVGNNQTERIGPRFHSGPLDVIWLPEQEECKRELVYIYKFRVDLGNRNWKDLQKTMERATCRSLICFHAANKSDERNGYTLQMRMVGPEEEMLRLGADGEASLCGGGGGNGAGAGSRAEAGMESPHNSRARSAWMSSLWTALGAAAGLAFVTLLGICYFDKRSQETAEEKDEPQFPPLHVCTDAQMEALGLDTAPLVDDESFSPALEEVPSVGDIANSHSYSLHL